VQALDGVGVNGAEEIVYEDDLVACVDVVLHAGRKRSIVADLAPCCMMTMTESLVS
jgi:hypothetical protein